MKEYEYSYNVTNLKPYIEYCEKNAYEKVEETKQIRIIYRKEDKTMARITIKTKNGIKVKELDFKQDLLNGNDLIERKESMALKFEDEEAVISMLDFLNYKKDNTLDRKRIVYEKGNVKFEFDDYVEPRKAYVVAFEGNPQEVDEVYLELKELNEKYKTNE